MKKWKIISHWKKIRQINYLVILYSLVKPLHCFHEIFTKKVWEKIPAISTLCIRNFFHYNTRDFNWNVMSHCYQKYPIMNSTDTKLFFIQLELWRLDAHQWDFCLILKTSFFLVLYKVVIHRWNLAHCSFDTVTIIYRGHVLLLQNMNLYLSVLLLLGLVISIQAGEGDSYDKRCRYFDFIRACKVGCKALGHTTGIVTSLPIS